MSGAASGVDKERARGFVASIPHSRDLGMDLVDIGAGWAHLSLPYHERLIGDPETGVLAALSQHCSIRAAERRC